MTDPTLSAVTRHGEQWYRALFEESRDAIIISERDGAIVEANQAACDMFGYTREEIVGIDVRSLYANPRDRGGFRQEIEAHGFVRDYELKLRTRDGRELDCIVTTAVRRAADGSVLGYQGIVRDVTERKSLENKLLNYQQELRSLAAQMGQTEERERRRIAEGLHDQVSQTLAVAHLKLETLRVAPSARDRAQLMDQLQAALDQMDTDVRSLTFELSPPMLYALGIEAAIKWFAEQLTRQHGLRVRVEEDGHAKPLHEDTRALLFRCVRELLVNVVKHARAQTAVVRLCREGDRIGIEVADDGCGFAASELGSPGSHGGFGLFSIRERLHFAGGELRIESQIGHGTRCALSVPGEADCPSTEA